jgi:hypothetical protein
VDRHAQAAILRQQFEQLCALREPETVKNWLPTHEQQVVYASLLNSILNGVDSYRASEKRKLLAEGEVQVELSEGAFSFFHEKLEPRIPALRTAYEAVDPDGSELYALLEGLGMPGGGNGRVKATFDEGLQQIYNLVDRNPDSDFRFMPDAAYEVFDSRLIAFEPDLWLDRAAQLAPIRTDRKNVLLPVHVRLRLEELFRAYVFGCWLSIFALSRALVEYAILDNLHKFGVDALWPADRNGKRREKTLEHLIDGVAIHLPEIKISMDEIRTHGNEYLHPKPSRLSKENLFQRERSAKDVLIAVLSVTEALYRAKKTALVS